MAKEKLEVRVAAEKQARYEADRAAWRQQFRANRMDAGREAQAERAEAKGERVGEDERPRRALGY